MKNKFNIIITSFVICLTLPASHLSYSSEEQLFENSYSSSPFGILPIEVRHLIVSEIFNAVAFDEQVSIEKSLTVLAHVNKEWNQIIEDGLKPKKPFWKALHGVISAQDEATYQTFLNGALVYRPNPGSDERMIRLNMSDFLNPFKGTFDLSACGNAAQYLKITTDPSVFFEVDKVSPKLNIFIATHFFVKKKLATLTQHFKPIMDVWNKHVEHVAIFWRMGWSHKFGWFDHISSSPELLSSKNLSEIGVKRRTTTFLYRDCVQWYIDYMKQDRLWNEKAPISYFFWELK